MEMSIKFFLKDIKELLQKRLMILLNGACLFICTFYKCDRAKEKHVSCVSSAYNSVIPNLIRKFS